MTIGAIALSGMGMAQQTSDKVAYLFTYFTDVVFIYSSYFYLWHDDLLLSSSYFTI